MAFPETEELVFENSGNPPDGRGGELAGLLKRVGLPYPGLQLFLDLRRGVGELDQSFHELFCTLGSGAVQVALGDAIDETHASRDFS